MATRIRLARGGRKKRPFYRIVVADSRAPRDGRYIERIGSYDPLLAENKVSVDVERATHWLNVGAKPSHRVSKLLALQGVEHKLVVLPTPKAPAEGKPAAKGKAAEAKAEPKAEDKPAQEAEAKAQEKPPQAAEAGDQPVAEAKAEPEEKPAGKAKAEPEEKPAQEAKDEGAADEKPARSAAKGKGKAAQAEGAADEAAEPAGEGEAESAS